MNSIFLKTNRKNAPWKSKKGGSTGPTPRRETIFLRSKKKKGAISVPMAQSCCSQIIWHLPPVRTVYVLQEDGAICVMAASKFTVRVLRSIGINTLHYLKMETNLRAPPKFFQHAVVLVRSMDLRIHATSLQIRLIFTAVQISAVMMEDSISRREVAKLGNSFTRTPSFGTRHLVLVEAWRNEILIQMTPTNDSRNHTVFWGPSRHPRGLVRYDTIVH